MRRWPLKLTKILVFVLLFLTIVIAGFGNAVLHLWNWLMPELFGLHPITFWQAVGILVLASILTGGHRIVSTDVTSSFPKRSEAPATLPFVG